MCVSQGRLNLCLSVKLLSTLRKKTAVWVGSVFYENIFIYITTASSNYRCRPRWRNDLWILFQCTKKSTAGRFTCREDDAYIYHVVGKLCERRVRLDSPWSKSTYYERNVNWEVNCNNFRNPTSHLDDNVNVNWEPRGTDDNYMNINQDLKMEQGLLKNRMDFWKNLYRNVLGWMYTNVSTHTRRIRMYWLIKCGSDK